MLDHNAVGGVSSVSFFEKLKDATIGFSGYARLGRDRRGGFGYIAALLAIVLAINGYLTMVDLRHEVATWASQVEKGPDFGVRGGQFFFDGPMPFSQTLPEGTQLVVDTTGQTQPDSLAGRSAYLVTREALYIIQPGVPNREFAFRMLRNDAGKAELQQFLASRPERLVWFVYLFIYLFQLLFKAIDASILALIATLYGSMLRRPVPFELGFRMALYAMSLPVIIQWVFKDFTSLSPMGFTLWWSMATIYLIFGLRAYFIDVDLNPEGSVSGN